MTAEVIDLSAFRGEATIAHALEVAFCEVAATRGYDPSRAPEVAELVAAALNRICFSRVSVAVPKELEPYVQAVANAIMPEVAQRLSRELTSAAIELVWPIVRR